MVYPGTEAYYWAKQNKLLATEDFSKWLTKEGLHNTTITRPGLDSEELLEICNNARREFYIRPSYVMKKMAQSATKPGELKRNLKSSKTFFKHVMKKNRKRRKA